MTPHLTIVRAPEHEQAIQDDERPGFFGWCVIGIAAGIMLAVCAWHWIRGKD